MNNHTSIYDAIERDPLAWLEQAEGARMSAEAIFPHFLEAHSQHPSIPGIREQQLAFTHSFMLLSGLAFESLIKGLAVSKGIGWQALKEDGGHGLSEYVRRVTTVSESEFDLLLRLQEYLKWAGRYPIPRKPIRYLDGADRRKWKPSDPQLIPALFDRLKAELCEHAAKKTPNQALQPTAQTALFFSCPA